MQQRLSGVRVCIWDFDGTLYRKQPELLADIRASEIRVIMGHTEWNEDKAKEEFYKVYKVITPSGTKTVSLITHISNNDSALETAAYVDYRNYLKKDEKLINMFEKLMSYKHFMLVNGTRATVAKGLELLGLDPHIFSEIVTSEIVGETKPSEKGFLYIMKKTGVPAAEHLMIGDREDVDLAQARSLGMQTCLVWSKECPTVYDIVSMLP